jgi:hypothetical protein
MLEKRPCFYGRFGTGKKFQEVPTSRNITGPLKTKDFF